MMAADVSSSGTSKSGSSKSLISVSCVSDCGILVVDVVFDMSMFATGAGRLGIDEDADIGVTARPLDLVVNGVCVDGIREDGVRVFRCEVLILVKFSDMDDPRSTARSSNTPNVSAALY